MKRNINKIKEARELIISNTKYPDKNNKEFIVIINKFVLKIIIFFNSI